MRIFGNSEDEALKMWCPFQCKIPQEKTKAVGKVVVALSTSANPTWRAKRRPERGKRRQNKWALFTESVLSTPANDPIASASIHFHNI